MKRILEWFKASNRWKHLTYAIPVGFIDLGMAIGVASGMEFKDKQHGGKWDWIDWALTILGGSSGFLIKFLAFNSLLTYSLYL